MMRSRVVVVTTSFLVGLWDVGQAQEPDAGRTACQMVQRGATTVRGQLVAKDEYVDVSRSVFLRPVEGDALCVVTPTDDGAFEFQGIPPGRYRMGMGTLGLGETVAIELVVAAENVLVFEIPLYNENRLARCMRSRPCASVLARRTSVELDGDESEALRVLGYRIGVVLAGESWDRGSDWVACLDEAPLVEAALAEAFPNVAPVYECEQRETELEGIEHPIRALRHLPSDRLARVIEVDSIEKTSSSTATLKVSYHFAPLWAQGHRCELVRTDGVWRVWECEMEWIS